MSDTRPPPAPGAHRHGQQHWHRHDDVHDHGQDHVHAVVQESALISVGIDVGSSTTHLMLSELVVGRLDSHFHGKPEVLSRNVIYRSPVIFTPFLEGGVIDHAAISRFVEDSYAQAGITAQNVDTGAVICTGEAARKENARRLTQELARDSGRFVCATAGHHFEAVLAANGSGSVEASHHLDGTVINLDIGGGTAKFSRIRHGLIEETSAINVGARLIAADRNGLILRAEPAGLAVAAALGLDFAPGRIASPAQLQAVAARMALLLIEFLGLQKMSPLGRSLLLGEGPRPQSDPFWLICSGSVSEFVYESSNMDPGDLGPALGAALYADLIKRIGAERLHAPREGIRATVIGAAQFSLQASGETVFVADAATLPRSNVPVYSVPVNWSSLLAEDIRSAICGVLAASDRREHFALYFGGPERFGYSPVMRLAEGIAAACAEWPQLKDAVFICAQNMANTLGRELSKRLGGNAGYICLDEIEVGNLDYLDIGTPLSAETYLPVIVKSLVFGSGHRHSRGARA